jgi:dihydroorotase-like cyclic amidohydrolase
VIVDTDRRAQIDGSTEYKCGWSPADGMVTAAVVETTVLRGTVIYDDGAIRVDEGFGRPALR